MAKSQAHQHRHPLVKQSSQAAEIGREDEALIREPSTLRFPPFLRSGESRPFSTAQRIAMIQQLSALHGNHYVARMLIGRDGAPEMAPEEAEEDFKPTGQLSENTSLQLPKPITLKLDDTSSTGTGDYPMPSADNVAMAMHDTNLVGNIQREDSGPSVSAEAGTSVSSGWTFELEASYEDLLVKNLLEHKSLTLDFNLTPKMTFSAEKLNLPTHQREVSLENGLTLLQAHWMSFWKRKMTLEISAYAKHTFLPHLRSEFGGQAELTQNLVEQKIKAMTYKLDLKFSASGSWTTHDEDTHKPGFMKAADASLNFSFSF